MSERELLHSIVIAAPIDAVWAELTRLDGRQRVGRVIDVDPPRRLSHTQRVTTRDDPFTVVTWTLEEVDGGTRVSMRHTGWPEDTKKLHQVDGSWASIMPELKRVLDTGRISRGMRARYRMYSWFMWALPA